MTMTSRDDERLGGVVAAAHTARCAWSMHVDVLHFDGIVAVAQAVPWRYCRLGVAGRIGSTGAQRVTAYGGRPPFEGPVLPLVWPALRLKFRCLPFTFAGDADVDSRHWAAAGPCLS